MEWGLLFFALGSSIIKDQDFSMLKCLSVVSKISLIIAEFFSWNFVFAVRYISQEFDFADI